MQETNFDRLLHRYLHNELTPRESAKFTAWLDLLQKENAGDIELSPEAKAKLFERITSDITTVDEVLELYPRQSRINRVLSNRWLRIAATVVVILSVTFVFRDFISDIVSSDKFSNTSEKMILNDGTIVWLNNTSTLSYYEKDGGRFANFSGEALFEVAKNPASPFVISCGNIDVKVLGTSFKLVADSGQIELNVLTGKVNVTLKADKTGIDVNPNEKIIFAATGLVERNVIPITEIQSIVANTEYNMKFQNVTMDEVVEAVSKKFNVNVKITNKNLYKCHVTADFTDHSLADTLSILTELLYVKYHITGNTIELSGEGC